MYFYYEIFGYKIQYQFSFDWHKSVKISNIASYRQSHCFWPNCVYVDDQPLETNRKAARQIRFDYENILPEQEFAGWTPATNSFLGALASISPSQYTEWHHPYTPVCVFMVCWPEARDNDDTIFAVCVNPLWHSQPPVSVETNQFPFHLLWKENILFRFSGAPLDCTNAACPMIVHAILPQESGPTEASKRWQKEKKTKIILNKISPSYRFIVPTDFIEIDVLGILQSI